MIHTVNIRTLGKQDYLTTWHAMQDFTRNRQSDTPDELWLVEHFPVYTLGQNGKREHILNAGQIPVVQSDRGGQVTYHGPGQLLIYTLVDLKRKKINVREMVSTLENSTILLLKEFGLEAYAKKEAPGVYIQQQKICSVGLRVSRGAAYHGLAFNVQMDLEPFTRINPCGFAQLQMTQLSHFNGPTDCKIIGKKLIDYLTIHLHYTHHSIMEPCNGT